jgi:nucleoside-triphosphatase THEP1
MKSYSLPQLSIEQIAVVNAIKESINVKVSGVAGCGKTTTILGICSSLENLRVLVLTYNARLKIETRQKVNNLGLDNTEVHSYHAMCVRYYSNKGAKDDGIIEVIKNNIPPKKTLNFDIIILDECQDMTKCYYNFVKKIINDNNKKITICLFGDEKQNIFEFKGADERFLTHGQTVFKHHLLTKDEWKELQVHTSFRITKQMAGFINKYLIGYEKLKANKIGDKVRYMYINPFRHMSKLYQEVMYYLGKGFKHEDIFILAPSIKKNGSVSPIVKLENMLVKQNHPCFAPISDEAKIDEEVIKGKIVFSTFHQVKGLERPVVIMFSFDSSYFKYFARDVATDKCPNIIYVATTRAMKNLTVIHGNDQQPILSTITYDAITRDNNVAIVGGTMGRDEFGDICYKIQDKIPVKVTELIRFLDPQIIHNAIKMLDYTTHTTIGYNPINLPQKAVCTKNKTAEIVYDINGYAIPAYFEMIYFKTCSLLNHIDINELDNSQSNNYNKISFKFGQEHVLPINYLLYISTLYDACLNGYRHRTKQIASYDWLSTEEINKCNDVLKTHIGVSQDVQNISFEYPIKDCPFLDSKYTLHGVIDILDKDTNKLWEIKCTSTTDPQHIIQLAIYAWMLYTKEQSMYKYHLLNICKNETIELLYNHDNITSMIEYLLKCKYEKRKVLTDTEFIEDCLCSS